MKINLISQVTIGTLAPANAGLILGAHRASYRVPRLSKLALGLRLSEPNTIWLLRDWGPGETQGRLCDESLSRGLVTGVTLCLLIVTCVTQLGREHTGGEELSHLRGEARR